MIVFVGAVMVAGAYLIGSIPVGVLLARQRGIELRSVGSGNVGATNVGRALGRRWGLVCLVLDIAKGLVPTAAAGLVVTAGDVELTAARVGVWVIVGLATVLGHVFPVTLGWQGGKGVATSIGVGLGLFPYFSYPMAAAVVCYLLVRGLTGYVSLGSLMLAVTFPAWFVGFAWWRGWSMTVCWPLLVVAIAVGLLIVARHRDNLVRLLRGQEHRASKDPERGEQG